MQRKIVQQGAATLMISLPSKWAKEKGLKKGGEIDITEEKDRLVLSTKQTKSEKAVIDISRIDPLINRAIMALYIRGVDEIEVKFDNPDLFNKIQTGILSELIGFEIVHQSKNSCTIKQISAPTEEEFDNVLKRIFMLIEQMTEESLEAMKAGKTDLKHIQYIDYNINRFSSFCLRILNKKAGDRHTYTVTESLEYLGDILKAIAKEVSEKKQKLSTAEIKIYEELDLFFRDFEKLFYHYSQDEAVKIAKKYALLIEKIKSQKQTRITQLLYDAFQTIITRMFNSILISSL